MAQAIFLALLSVCLSAAAQVILKTGMLRVVRDASGPLPSLSETIAAALATPIVWFGLVVYGASALAWLGVLARLDLSLAYPLVALGLVITCLLGVVIFHEPHGILKVAGVALVVVGVLMIGLSARLAGGTPQ